MAGYSLGPQSSRFGLLPASFSREAGDVHWTKDPRGLETWSLYSRNVRVQNHLLGEIEKTVLEVARCINCGYDYCGCWR